MFNIDEVGAQVNGNTVRFRTYLPSIDESNSFSVTAYVIPKKGQFDVTVPSTPYPMTPVALGAGADPLWGEVPKTLWETALITLEPGVYLYRYEITGPSKHDNRQQVRSLYFGEPFARETDAGIFSVVRVPAPEPFQWEDETYRVPSLDELILYELNVAEFGGNFQGIIDRLPYLESLGVNAIELMPINSNEEVQEWGYMPVFQFAPEERYGTPEDFKRLVNACHAKNIAVVMDMVYAHTDRMFSYQIGYDRFFDLWEDHEYTDSTGLHRSPNPLVCKYDNFGKKNDWRMKSTREFFASINAFWMREYHVDGFRYDHVNGYLDRKPDPQHGWYDQQNRPTFASLQELSNETYRISKKYPRFYDGSGPSRVIQIAEDLGESAYQLSPVSNSAINGNWEKKLASAARDMVSSGNLSQDFCRELLVADGRFGKQHYSGKKTVGSDTMPSLVVQYIESHDEPRLMYLLGKGKHAEESGFDYKNGLDDQPWWKLQPYAIALLTCVGIPMLWSGQEFAENTGLADQGQVRVRGLRPLHWIYFYNVAADPSGDAVLPLVTLYRNLGALRRQHAALRSPAANAKQESCNPNNKTVIYRRWQGSEIMIVALNFSDSDVDVQIPFGHPGQWEDVLEKKYRMPRLPLPAITVSAADASIPVKIPSNFGRILRLLG